MDIFGGFERLLVDSGVILERIAQPELYFWYKEGPPGGPRGPPGGPRDRPRGPPGGCEVDILGLLGAF